MCPHITEKCRASFLSIMAILINIAHIHIIIAFDSHHAPPPMCSCIFLSRLLGGQENAIFIPILYMGKQRLSLGNRFIYPGSHRKKEVVLGFDVRPVVPESLAFSVGSSEARQKNTWPAANRISTGNLIGTC